jgi:hypothetical protein
MTARVGFLYRLVRWGLRVVPVDASGRRVLDETLADWRRERGNAHAPVQRMIVALRSCAAVLRGLVLVSMREVQSQEGRAVLVRLAAWTAAGLLAFFALQWELLYKFGPTGGVLYGYDSLGLLSVSWITGLMPLLAFLSAAWAKRTGSPGPCLGPALIVAVATLALIGWVTPAAGQAFRELTLVRSGGTLLPQGLAELSLFDLIGRLSTERWAQAAALLNSRILWVIAAPVLLALGTTVRAFAGWRRLAGSVLPLLLFVAPFAMGIRWWPNQLWAFWGGLLGSALLVHWLARHPGGDDQAIPAGGEAS